MTTAPTRCAPLAAAPGRRQLLASGLLRAAQRLLLTVERSRSNRNPLSGGSLASDPRQEVRPGVGSAERRLLISLFVLASSVLLIVQEGAITSYDGQTVYQVTRSLVERRTFAVSKEFNTQPGSDGRHYSRYGLGLSLVAAIPYLAARPIALAFNDPDHVLQAAVSSVMAFITAALIVALYLLARRMGAAAGSALLVAVGAVAGTFVLPYSKEFFSEPLTTLCLVVAIERLVACRSGAAGLALGAAVLVRPQSLLFTPVMLLVAWLQGGAVMNPPLGLVNGQVQRTTARAAPQQPRRQTRYGSACLQWS